MNSFSVSSELRVDNKFRRDHNDRTKHQEKQTNRALEPDSRPTSQ